MGLLDGFFSLGAKVNKIDMDATHEEEGAVTDLTPEMELGMADKDLINLSTEWERAWESKKGEWLEKCNVNKNYWLGQHYQKAEYLNKNRPLADNLIFESLETFLPIATRQHPEP